MIRQVLSLIMCGLISGQGAVSQQPNPIQKGGAANIISPKLCFILTIPGNWLPRNGPGTYSSPDGKQFVGVLAFSAPDLRRSKGRTLVEKESAALEEAYQEALQKELADIRLAPFQSAMHGTWRWSAILPKESASDILNPKRFFIDLGPDGIIVLNIQGTPDDDALARSIIETLRLSKVRPCRLPKSTEELLKIIPETPDAVKAPNPATDPAPSRTYENPSFPWSLTYPGGWELQVKSNAGHVDIVRPGPGDQAACSIYSANVRFSTVEEFADFWLIQTAEHMKGRGIKVRRRDRKPISLPNGVTGVDVLTEVDVAGGRSRSIFVLADGVGYSMHCETSVKSWDDVAPFFTQILTSFALDRKP